MGYSNVRDTLYMHVDKEDKGVANCDSLGGRQKITIINESGLYSLILSSKLSRAREFKRLFWTLYSSGGLRPPQHQVELQIIINSLYNWLVRRPETSATYRFMTTLNNMLLQARNYNNIIIITIIITPYSRWTKIFYRGPQFNWGPLRVCNKWNCRWSQLNRPHLNHTTFFCVTDDCYGELSLWLGRFNIKL